MVWLMMFWEYNYFTTKFCLRKKSCLNHHIRHSFRTRHMTVVFCINLRPRQNGRHFADDIYKCIFRNEIVWISIKISLKFVPWGFINNTPPLVQMMAWRRTGDKPSFESMMAQCTDAYMNHPASMSKVYGARKYLTISRVISCHGNMGSNPWPLDSPHKGPVMRKAVPCHDVIKTQVRQTYYVTTSWQSNHR